MFRHKAARIKQLEDALQTLLDEFHDLGERAVLSAAQAACYLAVCRAMYDRATARGMTDEEWCAIVDAEENRVRLVMDVEIMKRMDPEDRDEELADS